MEKQDLREKVAALMDNIQKVFLGKSETVKHVVVGLLAGPWSCVSTDCAGIYRQVCEFFVVSIFQHC